MLDGSCRRSSPLSNHSFFTIGERKLQTKLQKEGLSQESSRLLSYLTNSYHKAVEISQEEWFNETKDAVAQWVKYLLKKDPQAFIFVQKAARFSKKKKEQQRVIFRFCYFICRKNETSYWHKAYGEKRSILPSKLPCKPKKKLQANVAFSRRC